jgi:hypothetical protein
MANQIKCAICGTSADTQPRTGYELTFTCPRCGNYTIGDSAQAVLSKKPLQNRGAVSGWIRGQNSMGITPKIGDDDLPRLRELTKPPFRERVERVLVAAAESIQRLTETFDARDDKFVGVSYSDDPKEFEVILEYLLGEGLIADEHSTSQYLTPRGYISADELRARRAASTQAFIAMSFADELRPAYEHGLEPGISTAGFKPMLIGKKEHANKIDDEIVAEIRRSAFIVADFTGHRQNVYFECGFAIGLGLQVIWTCKKDDIKHLHFDIRQYNCIDWEHPTELAQRLQKRIEAMFGRGPLSA